MAVEAKQPSPRTILATFYPQAWQNDCAIDVDAEGETTFDVTSEVLALGLHKARALKDNSTESDNLQMAERAPEWIKSWPGPYYIRVEDSVRDFFDF
ncbi:hypothetical protein HNP46_000329 [Pseudomonas nitritireducens]|uniref:Uncharacterized protein n=1 Tax=Pseudomonas nitroreducens TaxID=46680 RepID=A0A7W7NYB5_PSENT|nr:hypothetical protein [Pseudomonas nitritireducens]MBB4861518.1 hypothetical protein [Pseudomonas nitritireducens]